MVLCGQLHLMIMLHMGQWGHISQAQICPIEKYVPHQVTSVEVPWVKTRKHVRRPTTKVKPSEAFVQSSKMQ